MVATWLLQRQPLSAIHHTCKTLCNDSLLSFIVIGKTDHGVYKLIFLNSAVAEKQHPISTGFLRRFAITMDLVWDILLI